MIRPSAASQLTSIELVIGKPNTLPIATALCRQSVSSVSVFVQPHRDRQLCPLLLKVRRIALPEAVVHVALTTIDRIIASRGRRYLA